MKGRKILSALLGVVVFLVFAAVNVNATEIRNVPSGAFPTIQAAIDEVSSEETVLVLVAAGTYTLSYIITMKKGVSLQGAGANLCTLIGVPGGEVIVCGYTTIDNVNIIIDNATSIEGFTITHVNTGGRGIKCDIGSSPVIKNNIIIGNSAGHGGGGILCKAGSSPEIRNNQIIGNNTSDIKGGGGILCWNSSPTITDNTITGNHADLGGGGISCYDKSSPIIMHNDITGNTVSNGSGGGILCWDSSPTIKDNNTITGNHADLGGGGIACMNDSSPTISNNIITGNNANIYQDSHRLGGGGILCDDSSPTITNNFISGNTASYYNQNIFSDISGGGILCAQLSKATIINNIITYNSAFTSGGGISSHDSSPNIINNTIANNTADYNGGGINCRDINYSSSPIIKNNIIAWNTVTNGNGGGINCDGSSPDNNYNNVWNTPYEDYYDCVLGPNSITSDPLFVAPAPVSGNYHLQSESLCIDAGDNAALLNKDDPTIFLVDTDYDGQPRIVDGNDDTVEIVDMGADEFDPLSNTPPVAVDDSYSVDEDEILSVPTSEIYGVLKNDKDDDGDTLTAVLDENVSHGTLELNPDGSFTYEPDDDFHSTDTFTYKAHDGQVYSEKATVTITVNSVNDPPVADDQSIATDEDTAISIILKATDVEKDSLTYSVVLPGPVNGTLSGTAPNLIYTPVLNYFGVDSLTFKANDGEDFSNVATVSITITSVNDPPVADAGPDQTVAANDNCQAEVTLNGTAKDIDGDILTYTWEGPFGQASGAQPTVTLGKGTHEITLTVNDGNNGTASDTVQIKVEDQTPPVISLSDPILVSIGKWYWLKANILTVSATDNCSSDVEISIDKVEVFNKRGRPVWGKGVYSIVGKNIYVFPKGKGWSIHVTVTATDKSGNSETDTISKTLLKYKGWSWKSFFKLLFWKCFH